MELIIEAIKSAKGATVTLKQLRQLTEQPEATIKQKLTEYMILYPGKIMRNPGGYMVHADLTPARQPMEFKPYVPPKGFGERRRELYPEDMSHIGVHSTGNEDE